MNGHDIDLDQTELAHYVGRVSNEGNGVAGQIEIDLRGIKELGTYLSRTQKSSTQNLMYQETSTRSGSSLVLCIPINFYSYTCNNIYYLIVSIMYKTFLNINLLYRVMPTRSGST